MANIAERWGLIPDLQQYAQAENPLWGTCAGLIFLAKRAVGEQQPSESTTNAVINPCST